MTWAGRHPKDHLVATPCCAQRCHMLHQAAQGHIQPSLEHRNRASTDSLGNLCQSHILIKILSNLEIKDVVWNDVKGLAEVQTSLHVQRQKWPKAFKQCKQN